MARDGRPLSPHLQIYRWQLTMTMSIAHRITGVALSVGLLLLSWWLIAAASGPEAFASAQGFIGSWLGYLMLFGWSVAFFYHLANGIRHLMWDTVHGMEMPAVYTSGYAVLASTAALTLVAWIAGIIVLGGRP